MIDYSDNFSTLFTILFRSIFVSVPLQFIIVFTYYITNLKLDSEYKSNDEIMAEIVNEIFDFETFRILSTLMIFFIFVTYLTEDIYYLFNIDMHNNSLIVSLCALFLIVGYVKNFTAM